MTRRSDDNDQGDLEAPPKSEDKKKSGLSLAPSLGPPPAPASDTRIQRAEDEPFGQKDDREDDNESETTVSSYQAGPGAYREGGGFDDEDHETETVITSSPHEHTCDMPMLTAERVHEPEMAEIVIQGEQEEKGWWSKRRNQWAVFGINALVLAVVISVVLIFTMSSSSSDLPPAEPDPIGPYWMQVGNEIAGFSSGDHAGYSVALSSNGTIVAVGAPFADTAGINAGQVTLYELSSNNVWSPLGQSLNATGTGDWFGRSIDLSADGSILAAGSSQNSPGYVRLFRYHGGEWVQIGNDLLGSSPDDHFGLSVSLSEDGNRVAAGAIFAYGSAGAATGHVLVFQVASDGQTWSPIGSPIEGEREGDQSGWSVSLSSDGNAVAIGSYANDDTGVRAGHVRVFQYDENRQDWTKLGSTLAGEAEEDEYGISVSLSSEGNVVAIGGWKNDGNGENSGHVRVYLFTDNDDWTQIDQDIDGDAPYDESGRAVALSSDETMVAVGAPRDGVLDPGQVRVYKVDGADWSPVGDDIHGEEDRDNAGFSVALSSDGTTVAVGARWNSANGESSGHVRVFRLEEEGL